MLEFFSRYPTYTPPLEAATIKSRQFGGYVEADFIHLTKYLAYYGVDRVWWKFRGVKPGAPDQEDAHWKWVTFVRRLRKNEWTRCFAIRTRDDNRIQGAIIYRRDGKSLLNPGADAVFGEYLATAPWNRRQYAESPSYLGVGEALAFLAIVHSYEWGLGGRVSVFSLPGAVDFYKKMKFIETGAREGRMIHYELPPSSAQELLEEKGII